VKKINNLEIFNLLLLALYPLALIAGNFLINLFIILFSLNFFFNLNKNIVYLKQKIYYLLFFFLISLIINLFLSNDLLTSLPRVLKILFIIIFIFEIQKLIQNFEDKYIKYIYLSWFIIFIILSFDIVFEIFFGHNTLGFSSTFPGRIASFFGDELVAGAFYHGFALIFLSFLIYLKPNNYFLFCLIAFILAVSFFIGERSNFIKLFISIIFFVSLAIKVNFKAKLIALMVTIFLIFSTITLNESYKVRYYDQIKTLFSKNGYSKYLKDSMYGAHYNTAYKIFKENFYFGIGIKNFRNEVRKEIYVDNEFKFTEKRVTTHPHQVHYEFLSETGIVGYLAFLFFIFSSLYLAIKSYFKNGNLYQLSGIIFVITSILPIIPSGSFFSTYSSGIFWINFAIMTGYLKKLDFKV
tara:strand:- start:846 stop:2075 length:1230 start_codon:yes stop_codon:yes gene_type:complete